MCHVGASCQTPAGAWPAATPLLPALGPGFLHALPGLAPPIASCSGHVKPARLVSNTPLLLPQWVEPLFHLLIVITF